MTTYLVGYRAVVYAPRSVDATEATVLTPAAGAVHSDAFQVASMQGVSGYQPYLGIPDLQYGELDPKTRRVSIGRCRLPLQDQRTTAGGTNLERWGTAFLGSADGVNQLLGCKAVVQETLDQGSTWTTRFTGRIVNVELDGALILAFTLRGMAAELDAPCFVGAPHTSVSYAVPMQVLPLGLGGTYGQFTVKGGFSGTVGASTAGVGKKIAFSSTAISDVYNTVSDILRRQSIPYNKPGKPRFSDSVLVKITAGAATGYLKLGEIAVQAGPDAWGIGLSLLVDALPAVSVTSITRSGSTATATVTAHGWDTGMTITIAGATQTEYNGEHTITVTGTNTFTFTVSGTPASPATGTITASAYQGYIPMPSNGTAVTFAIHFVRTFPDTGLPIFLDDSPPATLLADLLDGKFGYLTTDGRVKRAFGRDTSSFTALASDASLATIRLRLNRSWKTNAFLEAICLQTGLGYYEGANGNIYLIDMRWPNTLPSPGTLQDSDLDAATAPQWEQSSDGAIVALTVRYYEDFQFVPNNSNIRYRPLRLALDAIDRLNHPLIESFEKATVDILGREDLSNKSFEIDAFGLRHAEDETVTSGTNGEIDREVWVQGKAAELAQEFVGSHGSGPAFVTLRCRRTATVTALVPGSWVLSALTKLPDPATNQRGGTRLLRVLRSQPDGAGWLLRCLDAGPNAIAVAPTVGTLGAGTDAQSQITVPITLNALGEPVVLHIAVTDTATGTAPTESSGAWVLAVPDNASGVRITADGTYTLSGLPAGLRVWVRARSEPLPSTVDRKLPSAWAFSTGTDYQDTTGLTAPSSVTNTPSDTPGNTDVVVLTWTPGSTTYPVEVELTYVSGAGATVSLPRQPAGTSQVTLNAYLTPNTVYTPKVREVDGIGGVSSWASASNLTIGSGFTGPTLSVGTLILTEYAA